MDMGPYNKSESVHVDEMSIENTSSKSVIGRDGTVFGIKFPTIEDFTYNIDLKRTDQYVTLPAYFFPGMNYCCPKFSCLSNFNDLPDRALSWPFYPAYRSTRVVRDGFCPKEYCRLPYRQSNSLAFLKFGVDQFMWDTVQWKEGWYTYDPLQSTLSTVYFDIQHRKQQKINKVNTRRNVLNILIHYPYFNAAQFYHMTWRYKPARVSLELLMKRILTEMQGKLEKKIHDTGFDGFFCDGHCC